MRLRAVIATILCVMAAVAVLITAQDRPQPTHDQNVKMLFVLNADDASLANGKLMPQGVSPTTVFFSDRPKRIAGH